MEKLTKAEIRRREKRQQQFIRLAEQLLEVNIVYAFRCETDKNGIYGKLMEFMSDYCYKHKINN